MSNRIDEIKERWRNWGNVLLRVRALPAHVGTGVGIGVANEKHVPDVVGFVYGADGDVTHLLGEVEQLREALADQAVRVEYWTCMYLRNASVPEEPWGRYRRATEAYEALEAAAKEGGV